MTTSGMTTRICQHHHDDIVYDIITYDPTPMKDILGQAIADHFHRSSSAKLRVHTRWGDASPDNSSQDPGSRRRASQRHAPQDHSSQDHAPGNDKVPRTNRTAGASTAPRADKSIMPVKTYFRKADEMPQLEWIALQHCRGRILDIGAGAGSHALLLQKMGLDVTALDISPLNAKVMKERGIKTVIRRDFFSLKPASPYDTLLLLMNGIGIAATLDGLHLFLQKARTLIHPQGALVFDSSDVKYLYKGHPPKEGPYYGEIFYQYEYRRQRTDWFRWLFVDKRTLRRIARQEGWKMQLLFEDSHDQYLVKLTPIG